MHFRSSNEKNYYYSRTFRFVFNDNKKNLGLIDSYATKGVSIDYDDILEKFVIDVKFLGKKLWQIQVV